MLIPGTLRLRHYEFRLEQLTPYRRFLGVLTQVAIDPDSPLPPFSEKTKPIRDKSIELFGRLREGTRLTVPAEVEKIFPRVLWLLHLGILFSWIFNKSPDQKKTHRILNKGLDGMLMIVRFLKLPLIGKSLWPLFQEVEAK